MKACLKRLHSPDIDLDSFWPEKERSFAFLVQAMIGPIDEDSEESFDFIVCTPDWLLKNERDRKSLFGRGLLLVFEYDLAEIRSRIARLCEQQSGKSWVEIAEELNKYGRWEFDNFSRS